ncbi:MAG: ATP-binding cassette domain-containing protein [Reinekea sp.]
MFNQRQWLHTSTLWPLTEQQQSITNLTQQALEANHKRRQQQELLVWAETMLITLSLIWLILFAHQLTDLQKDHAIWAVPFIFLVAVRDWLLPAFTALSQAQGSHWQPDETAFASPQDMEPEAANNISIQLEQFQWCRGKRCGPVLNFKHQGPGIVLFSAPSGAGKSSTFSALVGELAFQGQAMINGQSAQNMSASQRHQQIHYTEQFGHIFSATLGENLTLAAHKPDSELIAALNWAGLNDWANKSALQQWIGEGGRPISGGEQKRLLLARAYLSDAPILLLDEPFEALDHSTTQIIAQRLTAMSQIRLILIATHIKPDGLDVSQVLQCDLLPQ